jgi:hypothetical protein
MKTLLKALLASAIALVCAQPAAHGQAYRAAGVQISTQLSSPIAATKGGFWWDGATSGPLWRKADGTDLRILASTLQLAYTNGAAGQQVIQLTSTNKGVQIQDTSPASVGTWGSALTPVFGVTNSSGVAHYLAVDSSGVEIWPQLDSYNGNPLVLGANASKTTSVVLGTASIPTSTGGSLTVGTNLTVTGSFFSSGVDRSSAGTFSVCGTNCTTLQLGGAASTLFNFNVSGATVATLNSSTILSPATSSTGQVGDSSHLWNAMFANAFRGTTLDPPSSNTLSLGTSNASQISAGGANNNITTFTQNRFTITQNAAAASSALQLTGGALTNITASTEVVGANLNFAATKTWLAGALAQQREVLFQAPTYAFASASTLTTAATVDITGPPIAGANATITNSFALRIESGFAQFQGGIAFPTDNVAVIGSASNRAATVNAVAGKFDSLDTTTATAMTIAGGTATQLTLGNSGITTRFASNTVTFSTGAAHQIDAATAAVDTAGWNTTIKASNGGAASVTGGGKGGGVVITASSGGNGTAALNPGGGGDVTITNGSPGTGGTGNANSGDVIMNVVAAVGSGVQGRVRFQNAGSTDFSYLPATHAFVSNTAFQAQLGQAGGEYSMVYSRHYHGAGTAPTIAVGASGVQLGVTPSAAVTAGSDTAGTVTITTGTGPTAFVANTAVTVATVTFNTTYATAAPRAVVIVPASATAGAAETGTSGITFYAEQSSTSTSQFVIKAITAGTPSLTASTAYAFAYVVIQ